MSKKISSKKTIPAFIRQTAIALTAGLAACGGGGTTSTPTETGNLVNVTTQSTAVGPITGFGSIIVNGVRYDDSASNVIDDHGSAIGSSALRLGMMVEVKGRSQDDGTGSASSIEAIAEVQGPLSNLNATSGTFKVFGINVQTNARTVFANIAGLSSLSAGATVEVHGLRNADTITASRVEFKTPTVGQTTVKLRGAITQLNSVAGTFNLSGANVSFTPAQVFPAGSVLAEGNLVSIRSTSAVQGSNVLASRVQNRAGKAFGFEANASSEITGLVSAFQSISSFSVGSVAVNASNAVFVRGAQSTVANGARLQVKGTLTNNVLIARLVKFEDSLGQDEFEVHGAVSNFVSLANFTVRGIQVDATNANVLYERGTATNVANGRQLEVEGSLQTTATGSILLASKIKFEDVALNASAGGQGEFESTGKITAISTDSITIGGRKINIAGSTIFRKIARAQLVVGVLVEVKGTTNADGSINAIRISLED